MHESKNITIYSRRKEITIPVDKSLYIFMKRNNAEIHVSGDKVYVARRTYAELSKELDDSFMEVRRGCMVSVMAIHDVTKQGIELINGEYVKYTARRKSAIIAEMRARQQLVISSFFDDSVPKTPEEYRQHYISFEKMPFAFTDIEMVFNQESHAVDWIFRYGNSALAKLEKLPLEQLIGSKFGSLFANMDTKWLRSYERSALYGEILEIVDYSPEIDTSLKIISFPTFRGHCGCILFDVNEINFTGSRTGAENLLRSFTEPCPEDNR